MNSDEDFVDAFRETAREITAAEQADENDEPDDPSTHEIGCTCLLCIPGA